MMKGASGANMFEMTAAKFPNRTAIIFEDRFLTWKQVDLGFSFFFFFFFSFSCFKKNYLVLIFFFFFKKKNNFIAANQFVSYIISFDLP